MASSSTALQKEGVADGTYAMTAKQRGLIAPETFTRVTLKTMPTRLSQLVNFWTTLLGTVEVTTYQEERFVSIRLVNFTGYSKENEYRIDIFGDPNLKVSTNDEKPGFPAVGVDHIAFTYANFKDLASTVLRLKSKGIIPTLPINHGPTVSFYYTDPDGTKAELQIDVFDRARDTEAMKDLFAGPFMENPIGIIIDPTKWALEASKLSVTEENHKIVTKYPEATKRDKKMVVGQRAFANMLGGGKFPLSDGNLNRRIASITIDTTIQKPEPKLIQNGISPRCMAHIVLRTVRPEKQIAFYKTVFNCLAAYESKSATFITYDDEHHRFGIIVMPVANRSNAPGVSHCSYTFSSIQELYETYLRLANDLNEAILPIHSNQMNDWISLFYMDPDGNHVELTARLHNQYGNNDTALDQWLSNNNADIKYPLGETFDYERDWSKVLSSGMKSKM